jgi:peptidoglycan/LPS O-acetylase OafA/YrhL
MTHTYPTHIRIDGLFFGVFLGYLHHFKTHLLESLARYRILLVLLGVALISPMMIVDREIESFVSTFGLTMLYLGYGCILVAMIHTPVASEGVGKFFSTMPTRVIAFIGYFSYTIYLWHLDIAYYPMSMLVRRGLLKGVMPEIRWVCLMVVYVIIAVVTGAVLGMLVEKPALALRDRLFPARADALTKPAESLSANTLSSVTTELMR